MISGNASPLVVKKRHLAVAILCAVGASVMFSIYSTNGDCSVSKTMEENARLRLELERLLLGLKTETAVRVDSTLQVAKPTKTVNLETSDPVSLPKPGVHEDTPHSPGQLTNGDDEKMTKEDSVAATPPVVNESPKVVKVELPQQQGNVDSKWWEAHLAKLQELSPTNAAEQLFYPLLNVTSDSTCELSAVSCPLVVNYCCFDLTLTSNNATSTEWRIWGWTRRAEDTIERVQVYVWSGSCSDYRRIQNRTSYELNGKSEL